MTSGLWWRARHQPEVRSHQHPVCRYQTIQVNTKQIAELYFEAAAAAVTPDPEVEVGSPKVTVLELVQATDGFGSWCGIYGSTVRQRVCI